MFKISLASLTVALFSISALAAPLVTEHERALQKASKWSDVTAQLKGRLPSNVVKEFADFAKDEEFPTSRRIKNRLVIIESDGTKVTIEYKRDGAISLNGKEWKLHPLATVEEEVARLALFINGEKKAESGFLGLVPAAQAGGAAVGGAAIAAFAGANAWKAESCGEKELSNDLVNDCPLMAVKMQPILVKARKIDDPELFLPVNLKCPGENSGTLELISRNISGISERIRVVFKSQKPQVIELSMADTGSTEFEQLMAVKMDSNNSEELEAGKHALKTINPLFKDVCQGSKQNKKRYFASLEANRRDLMQSNNDTNSNEKSAIESL